MSNVTPFVPRRPEPTTTVDGTSALALHTDERAVYSVKEVSHLLTLSLGGTYALVRNGTIPALKLAGRWVIPKKRFHVWLDGLTELPDPDVSATNLIP